MAGLVWAACEVRITMGGCKHNGMAVLCMEALLNKVFYEEFEYAGFEREKSGPELHRHQAVQDQLRCVCRPQWVELGGGAQLGSRPFSQDFSRLFFFYQPYISV